MKIKVYQIDHEKDSWNVMFMDYAFTRKHGGVNPAVYKTVFDGNVDAENLEEVFALLNTQAPVGYNGHSLSVSDIVETEEGFHFCDSFGFRNWSPLMSPKPNRSPVTECWWLNRIRNRMKW